ncbi:MAG: DUF2087 domain-containing protein [Oscillospiraceae bacterium]|nr:DUF2087 domain-containing protein [Oscillospiraceae bacterium]
MKDFGLIAPFLDENGRLKSYPTKHKKKLMALEYLATKLETDRIYTEKEINDLINSWCLFRDPATLRREMYNSHLIDRTRDCRQYWAEKDK